MITGVRKNSPSLVICVINKMILTRWAAPAYCQLKSSNIAKPVLLYKGYKPLSATSSISHSYQSYNTENWVHYLQWLSCANVNKIFAS